MTEDWIECTLNDIAVWGSGGTPKSTNSEFYNGGIPWLIIGDLNDGYVNTSEKSITKLGLDNSSAKLVKPNSVLIAMYGSIGKLGINSIEVATNQAIAFTKFLPPQILNKYLFHYLFYCRPKLHAAGKGGTQINISQTVLKQFVFTLIPLPEQRAIVAKIEELFSDLDKGVADLKKAQDQLKVYRQAVLKKAFKELVNKGWEESLLGDISSKITKGSTPTTYGFKYQNEGINFIKIENVIDGKIDKKSIYQFISEEAHENQKRSQLHDGDVLFSIAGTIGETCLITKDLLPANTNQAFAIISGFNQVLDPNFLRKQLDSFMSRKLKDKARGGAMNNVSLTDLKNLKVVIPEMEIQHQVVKEIESRLSVCDKVEENITESLEKAEALRQSILKKAFEGRLLSTQEIEKCKTAPDYEPAAVLLEKIKSQRHENR